MQPGANQKTVLVVDDQEMVLSTVARIISLSGYHVLTAASGPLALAESRSFKGEIHLLLSDFQMPGMSGVALATQMTVERPQLKVLLMSGFTDGMLVLNEGWHFLSKPFVTSQLRALVAGLVSPDSKSRFAQSSAVEDETE